MVVAIAVVTDSSSLTTTNYHVQVQYQVRDGANTNHSASVYVDIPHGTNPVVADRALRQAVADEALNNWSLTIDPGDVYFPAT